VRHNYTLNEALDHTGVDRMRLQRWCDAEIIKTGGGGAQGRRREFSFRNLIELVVCDELRGLGYNEPAMRWVVENLNSIWDQPDAPSNSRRRDAPTYRDAPIIWIAFHRLTDSIHGDYEAVAMFPVDAADLVSRVTTGEADGSGVAATGTAIPIGRIIHDLEAQTGDKLYGSWRDEFEKAKREGAEKLAAAIRRELKRDNDSE
jgi:hypothetical protein